jgi:hypothetical protein
MRIAGFMKSLATGAVVVTGLVAASCGGSGDPPPAPTPTQTPTETAYVSDVRSAWGRF